MTNLNSTQFEAALNTFFAREDAEVAFKSPLLAALEDIKSEINEIVPRGQYPVRTKIEALIGALQPKTPTNPIPGSEWSDVAEMEAAVDEQVSREDVEAVAQKWAGVASVEAAYHADDGIGIAYDQRFLKVDGREG